MRSSLETSRVTEYYLQKQYGEAVQVEYVDITDPAAQARFPEQVALAAERGLAFPLVLINGELALVGSAHLFQVLPLVQRILEGEQLTA